MAGSFEIDNDKVIITFEYNPLIENGQNVVDMASYYVFRDPLISFEDLTNQDKLDLLDKHIKLFILSLAKKGRVKLAQVNAELTYPIDL